MPATLTISDDGTYILLDVTGEETYLGARELLSDLIAMVKKSGVRNVLVDARSMTGPSRTLDVHRLGSELGQYSRLGLKIAVIVNAILAEHGFLETVAVNRAFSIRFFKEYDQALAWLAPRPQPPAA